MIIALDDGQRTTLEAGWIKNTAIPSQSDSVLQRYGDRRDERTVMPRREIVEAFSNLPRILQQAKATPVISDTGMDGVSFEVIESASILTAWVFRLAMN